MHADLKPANVLWSEEVTPVVYCSCSFFSYSYSSLFSYSCFCTLNFPCHCTQAGVFKCIDFGLAFSTEEEELHQIQSSGVVGSAMGTAALAA